MEDQDVLRHLLEIEAQASSLVDDAQAEADRRLKESEEQNRTRYDEEYRSLVEKLEAGYKQRLGAVRAEYTESLENYRASLDSMPRNAPGFNILAHKLMFENACPAGGK
jgi:vacuolar-type H+-ATPase subunit H